MTDNQLPTEEVQIPAPEQAEEQISKEEINKNIEENWKLIDSAKNWQEYKQAWDRLDYYKDLKTKLYK